jgi:aldehyde:ferredoxin oxidoreductase
MGTALFWEEVDKDYITDTSRITGFEPENVICIVPGVLSGTMVPGGARTEVCGIAPEVYPRPQFIRGNFGGCFAPMLKFAGYDAIVVTGRADGPVWVDIRDDVVAIRDAADLWGLGFYDTEKAIWHRVTGESDYRNEGWHEGTTQRAAVLGIGQGGESVSRIGCLVHGADTAAGCGGFGGVFGAKNLKAISVIGTGGVEVANPRDLMETWRWVAEHKPRKLSASFPAPLAEERRISCFGCMAACKVNKAQKEMRGSTGQCIERAFYVAEDRALHGENTRAEHVAGQLAQDYGINLYAVWTMLIWLESLHRRGLLGKDRRIHTDLDFDSLGTEEFIRDYLRRIAFKEEIGADLSEGSVRAAAKWGILEEELMTGALSAIHWGIADQHWTDNVEWAYLSLFDARDCNAHDIQHAETLEKTAERYAELAPPWHDPLMLDQSRTGVYSIHCARLVAWHSRYVNMKGSMPWCDWFPFDTFNALRPDGKGLTPEMEERLYAAVTGESLSWEEMLEIGRRMWNFKRAILVLHGRHRDEEYFPPYPPYTSYVYTEGPPTLQWGSYNWTRDLERGSRDSTEFLPWEDFMRPYGVYENGEWKWSSEPFPLDKARMDEFKTRYYDLEGWDVETGWPTRSTLRDCGLAHVAEVLERQGKHLKP